ENFSRLGTVLYNLLEAIRFITVMIEPIMPQTATLIFNQLNISPCDFSTLLSFGLIKEGEKTSQASPLFARIDEKIKQKEIEQLNKKYEKSQNDNNIIKDEKPEGIITIDDFTKVSLCVAKILNCEAVEKSDKLLKLILNDGIGERQVVSGIATWYKPEDLINKKVIIVSNLKPVKLRGVVSNGMILAADASKDNVKVIFIDDSIPCGAKIR
ncbi:MAG: methionine--tRNA ligase subunit beta, partial [Oscillospiraceae bacterium]